MAKRTILVTVFCNDPDNGMFVGRADAIAVDLRSPHDAAGWGDSSFDLQATERGFAFSVDLDAHSFRLHRRRFRYKRRIPWHGNWCGDGFVMTRAEGKRLLGTLRASGQWCCTDGPTRLFDWFNAPRSAGG